MTHGDDTRDLDLLEHAAITIIREAYATLRPLAMLWSMGKDSTALLWLVRKAFYGEIPFPMIQLDTELELDEVYAFRDQLARNWKFDLRVELCPPEHEMDPSLPPATRAAARKTEGLKNYLQRENPQGIIVGIRRDEQATRAKERIFSPRSVGGTWDVRAQPPELWGYYTTDVPHGAHVRVHPLLHWTELDIWRYTRRENIPYVDLYLARDGMRYRSLGEKNITVPIASTAASLDEIIDELTATREPERAGRVMDRESEDSFERLRAAGYM